VGFDAFSEAREAVRKGLMDATVAQSPFDMGKLAVENASRVLKGEPIQEDTSIKIKLITKDNVDEP
jgi:ribose transport system substrate-binding protein